MNLENKRVLVIGSGISGIAATKLLETVHAVVTLYDSNDKLDEKEIREKLPKESKVNIILGKLDQEVIDSSELVVLSPGVPTDLDYVIKMQDKKIPIWGEVELAYNFSKGKIVAITGTNGKTTTTALVGEIMKTYFESVFVLGNIGVPYTEMVLDMKDSSVTVAEMSSFQLETIHDFKPNVSAILNITPDHLNRHHSMKNYINAKVNITKNQDQLDTCVLNYEDIVLREIGEKLTTNILFFSSQRKLENGVYLDGENIIYSVDKKETVICNVNELNIFGRHSYENVMAGVAIAIMMKVPFELIKKAITTFVAVEHRIEYVTTRKGVKYYNDSKGTNPDAAIKAIQSMRTPTILIGGGYDKGSEYDEWIEAFDNKVKYLILLGQTRDKIADTAKKLGFHNIIMVESLEEAVRVSSEKAENGDSVLLSPACASWGMFKNYEERGLLFKQYVNKLEE